MPRFDTRFALVLTCFAFSGFAGLLYETAWTREFSFVFGTSGLAVSTVLAAYMGGLALGAAVAARYVDRIARPVLVYGLLELGIALSALAVPFLIEASRSLHLSLLRGVADPGSPIALGLYLVTSFAILGIPTTFMGATLPLLARHAVHSDSEIGSRIGALYALNTAGAIAGTLVTAYFLMPALGLRGTVYVGAAINGLVFLGAAWLARGHPLPGTAPVASAAPVVSNASADTPTSTATPRHDAQPALRAILAIAFGAGIASFTYEVMWVRLLEHLVGGSVYAFSAMLASFLLGIALGGAVAARFANAREKALTGLALSQIGAAGFGLLAYRAVSTMPAWAGGGEVLGDDADTLRLAGLATLVLLPSTLCIGALFPFAVRAASDHADDAAASSARVYSWNTLGAIVGSVGTGFVFLPTLGFAGTLVLAVALNGLLAVIAWAQSGGRSRAIPIALAIVVLATLVMPPRVPWMLLRNEPLRAATQWIDDDRNVLFHAIGRSASVLALAVPTGIRIRTNGIPESLITYPGMRPGHVVSARWMGVLPALAPAGTERMLVIGLGGSVALEMIPRTVRAIDVVELEPEVVEANRVTAPLRQFDPSTDERIRVRIGDARSILELERDPYDAIVSQPSHPWTAGSSHLYTREFFERTRARMAPDGVFVQWLGLSFVDEPLLRSFVATLQSVFPNVRLYRPTHTSALFVASANPLDLESRLDTVYARAPRVFDLVGLSTPEDLAAALSLDEEGTRAFAGAAPPITDDRNLMATRAPRVRGAIVEELDAILAPYDPLLGGRPGLEPDRLVQSLIEMKQPRRANRFVESLPPGPARDLATARLAMRAGNVAATQRLLDGIPDTAPEAKAARWQRIRLERERIALGEPLPAELDAEEDAVERLVTGAWRSEFLGKWPALAAIDDALAAIPRDHPARSDADVLRISWRLSSSNRARGREALILIDHDVRNDTPPRLANRAYAAALAGEESALRTSLEELTGQGRRLGPALAQRCREALEALPEDRISAAERRELEGLIRRAENPPTTP